MTPSGLNKKVANGLVAASCAAVLAVYSAGYIRTRGAAERFEVQAAERRTAVPDAPQTATPVAEFSSAAPDASEPRPAVVSAPTRDSAETPNLIASAEPALPASGASPEVTPSSPTIAIAEIAPATLTPPPLPEPKVEIAAPAPAAAPKWKDGTYLGWGTSRHGDIQAAVVIESGRIASATIAQCRTRYSCSVIDMLPPQVAQRQSPDVDYVSRATQSANAFYYAVVDALSKAK
ncbi:MAG TPA: hypothetical protein VGQ34_12830 [Sphingomicrobium sp.]|jgi:uncharacterized protein with FMN-binding domain|nr:hypothetical protein [Sphingomicrobium sp.]